MTRTDNIVSQYTSDGVIWLDSSGDVRAVNPAGEKLLQIASKAIIGKSFWHSFPEAHAPGAQQSLTDLFSAKHPIKFELFFPRRYIWLSILGVPDVDGPVLFMRDISDRVRLMHTEAVQEGVRAILEVAPIAISITHGKEHRTTLINAKARELIGNREVLGIPVRKAFPEIEGQGLFEILDEVWQSGIPYTGSRVPVTYFAGDSEIPRHAFFDVSYMPLVDSAGVIYAILSTSVDVTEVVERDLRLEPDVELKSQPGN